jgi:hypothetical protein
MKFFYFLYAGLLLTAVGANAQVRKTFKIKPGEKIIYALPPEEVFEYPNFIQSEIYFKKDGSGLARLNYNALYGEIQFIDPKGDTLSLDDEATVRFIVILSDTFYFDKLFVKQVKSFGEVRLAKRTYFKLVNSQKLGGFGEATGGSVDTYDRISSQGTFKDLVAKEILTLAKDSALFLADRYRHLTRVSKKGLQSFYEGKESQIAAYLKENKVNYNDEADITRLMQFMMNQ